MLPYRTKVWQEKSLANFIHQTVCSSTTIISILTILPNFILPNWYFYIFTKLLSYTGIYYMFHGLILGYVACRLSNNNNMHHYNSTQGVHVVSKINSYWSLREPRTQLTYTTNAQAKTTTWLHKQKTDTKVQ